MAFYFMAYFAELLPARFASWVLTLFCLGFFFVLQKYSGYKIWNLYSV